MTELFQDLLAWVAANPIWAHLTVFLVAMTESLAVVGILVPGVIMMLGAGALIATGALEFWPVCLWAIAGAVVGDGLSYWLGRRFEERLKSVWPFTRYPEGLAAGVAFFEKYGGKGVAFGRFVGPVRAVIPLVAGMMGMSPARFLVANVASALAWAPAYLLPGIIFGASLELAAEAAFHLVVLTLSLVVAIWLTAWVVQQLFLFFSPKASTWVQGALHWAEIHPRMGEIARALADPHHRDAGTLAALAALLVLATALFGLAMGFAIAGAPELRLNQAVLDLALSLHAPAADHLMAAFSRLGDAPVTLPFIVALYVWLRRRGERRQANYWLAAGAFALLAGPLLAVALQVPRPDIGLTGLSPWGFPSGHVLRATVVYGFLAVSLASGIGAAWRWLPYVWAAMSITAVAVSRLYFGAQWLTDVLGSLALGLAWIAALGLALRRHTEAESAWRSLGAVALATLSVAFGIRSAASHGSDLALYGPSPATIAVNQTDWRNALWRSLPQRREDLRQINRHAMTIQYAGSLEDITARLGAKGWVPAEGLSWSTAMKLLSPSLPLDDLPAIPHVHDGHHESLALVKPLPDGGRLVLRLWATPYRIDGGTPLWIGNATAQYKRVILGLLAVPTTARDTDRPLQSARGDLSALDPFRPAEGAPLLLQAIPPGVP